MLRTRQSLLASVGMGEFLLNSFYFFLRLFVFFLSFHSSPLFFLARGAPAVPAPAGVAPEVGAFPHLRGLRFGTAISFLGIYFAGGGSAFCGTRAGWHGIPPGGLSRGVWAALSVAFLGVRRFFDSFFNYTSSPRRGGYTTAVLPPTHCFCARGSFRGSHGACGQGRGERRGHVGWAERGGGAITFVVFHAFYPFFPSRSLPLVFCGFDTILLPSFLVHGGFCVYVAIPTFILLHVLSPPGRLSPLPP
ncbi:hypothetical protein FB451DRAFT_118030 [Mycena latifolia]|nr:hypothetical protein FB451DRAFT_118030 [Mycena latifolia]